MKNLCKEGETEAKTPQLISYLNLRRYIGILGISLPVIIVLGSFIFDDCGQIQNSISNYYYTNMKNFLVGVLFAVALFLFAYKGYEKKDDIAGDLASLFALGAALIPTGIAKNELTQCVTKTVPMDWLSNLHLVSAGLFFIVLSYFSLCLFTKNSGEKTGRKRLRNIIYRASGFIMLACILAIGLYFWLFKGVFPGIANYKPVFWLESIALWAFGFSWLTKGKAIFADLKTFGSENANLT